MTTFQTGIGAGLVVYVSVARLGGVPLGAMATVQMRVWDHQGGLITDWATAMAQPAGTELVGASAPFNLGPLGELPIALVGLQSFNLTYVPEPSAFAVAGVGVILLGCGCSRKRARGRSD